MDNAEKANPTGKLELFGEIYDFRPTFGTLNRYQQITGKDGFDMLRGNFTAGDIVALVYAAIGGKDTGKTIDEVGDAIDLNRAVQLAGEIRAFMDAAQVPAEQKKMAAEKTPKTK